MELATHEQSMAVFRFLLPIHQDGLALNMGAAWGGVSISLARTFQQILTLDLQRETLRSSMIAAKEEDLDNVVPLNGSVLQIPLVSNICDLVVLPDILNRVIVIVTKH